MPTLHVHSSFMPLAFFLFGVTPSVDIDGVTHKCPWGWSSFELAPGSHTLQVSFPYFKAITGPAEVSFTLDGEDAVVSYAYTAPLLMTMDGKLVERDRAAPEGTKRLTGGVPHQLTDADAPHGIHPRTGLPLSSRSKAVAALLQIFLGAFGAGRFYTGHTRIALAQVAANVLTCGGGMIWPLIDGFMLLFGEHTDADQRLLK